MNNLFCDAIRSISMAIAKKLLSFMSMNRSKSLSCGQPMLQIRMMRFMKLLSDEDARPELMVL